MYGLQIVGRVTTEDFDLEIFSCGSRSLVGDPADVAVWLSRQIPKLDSLSQDRSLMGFLEHDELLHEMRTAAAYLVKEKNMADLVKRAADIEAASLQSVPLSDPFGRDQDLRDHFNKLSLPREDE